MTVPFLDLGRQHQQVAGELDQDFRRVLASSGFILGEEVARFEEEFAVYVGARYCVGVASGTAALALALAAAGVGSGDEVVVPAHTFMATALAALHVGATPVVCDVDAATGLIDPEAAAQAIGDRTAAIVAVHLYGQVADMAALRTIADRHGVKLVEDAAQAHGAHGSAGRAGTLGDLAAFSFYPSKNLGALGDGGAVCTDDPAAAERLRQLRNLGQREKGEHVLVGANERLDGLQAAFLRTKLRRLDGWNEARRRAAAAYAAGLEASGLLLLDAHPGSVWHLYPVRSLKRDALRLALGQRGVATGVHYSYAVHDHPAFVGRVRVSGTVTEAMAWAREELSLPMFETLTPQEIAHVVEACAEHEPSMREPSGSRATSRRCGC